jgi:hypothetical protein
LLTISSVSSSWLRRKIAHCDTPGCPASAFHDLHHRVAILQPQRHVHARHQREVVRHVALVAVAEVVAHVLGPLLASASSTLPGSGVEAAADRLEHLVRLRQVLVGGAVALDQVGHGIEPEAVDPEVEPELHRSTSLRAPPGCRSSGRAGG